MSASVVREPGLRSAAKVEHDLDQRLTVGGRMDGVNDLRGQRREQDVEVVDRLTVPVLVAHANPP
jgi:hypothetical protein